MSNPLRAVFATENSGKLHEVSQFAKNYGIEILSPSQAGLKRVKVSDREVAFKQVFRALLTEPN